MKTIGELLKTARLHHDLTLEQVSAATKIEIKYITALENNRFDLLPPPTFTKGFIRNLALHLSQRPADLIAIYRRDQINSSPSPSPTNLPAGRQEGVTSRWGLPSFSRSSLILLVCGIAVFLGYLSFQYRALLLPPPLTISQPQDKAVTTSPVTITGRTSPDSLVTIRLSSASSASPTTDVKPAGSGGFTTQLPLSSGSHRLEILATNRFGRTATKTVSLTVLSSD